MPNISTAPWHETQSRCNTDKMTPHAPHEGFDIIVLYVFYGVAEG